MAVWPTAISMVEFYQFKTRNIWVATQVQGWSSKIDLSLQEILRIISKTKLKFFQIIKLNTLKRIFNPPLTKRVIIMNIQ